MASEVAVGPRRILRLGNSDDQYGPMPAEARSWLLAARALGEATGLSFETERRVIWPTPALPDLAERWVRKAEPDIVMVTVTGFWVAYISVPVKLREGLGRVGPPLARAGLKLAGKGWVAHNAAFRTGRRAAVRTIGGRPHFEPEHMADIIDETLRRILRAEPEVVALRGPRPQYLEGSPAVKAWLEARLDRLNTQLERTCEQLHIEFQRFPAAMPAGEAKGLLQGDRLHLSAAGHVLVAPDEADLLIRAWRRAHGPGTARSKMAAASHPPRQR